MTKATGFVVTGDPETNLEYNYALGGLSNQWTGAVPRFCAEDFTAGEQVHEKYRWPVTYSDLAPYYKLPNGQWRSRPIQAMSQICPPAIVTIDAECRRTGSRFGGPR